MDDILFLAHRVPFPPNRGDKIRAHHLLKKLAELGKVHVGCFAENDEDRAAKTELEAIATTYCIADRTKPLAIAGIEAMLARKPVSLTAFHSSKLMRWVKRTVDEHNISRIVVFSGQMGQYVPDNYAGQLIVDLCDVDSAKFEGYASAGQRVWINSREGRLLRVEEERLARRADATILISKNEAELFKSRLQLSSLANVRVIGNGIDTQFFEPTSVEPNAELTARRGPHFVFTGQMDYPPNEAAALWAIENFIPAIRARFPASEFHVVGRNPTKTLMAAKDTPGVTVWGEVPDVRPFLAAADCVVTPLTIARGVQNKVLEAMAMAKPVLLTPDAATGIDAIDREHWLLCEADAEQMCARYQALHENPDEAFDLGSAARQFVLDNHNWDAMLEPLEELLFTDNGLSNAA